MKINVISVGHKMPSWVASGFSEYQKRLPADYQLHLLPLKPQPTMEKEGELILKTLPKNNYLVALDRLGKPISTQAIAEKLQQWHDQQQDLCLLIGGADGLSDACQKQAQEIWSLSSLTLPHQLVRIVVAEQLYRAWTMLNRHPYHR